MRLSNYFVLPLLLTSLNKCTSANGNLTEYRENSYKLSFSISQDNDSIKLRALKIIDSKCLNRGSYSAIKINQDDFVDKKTILVTCKSEEDLKIEQINAEKERINEEKMRKQLSKEEEKSKLDFLKKGCSTNKSICIQLANVLIKIQASSKDITEAWIAACPNNNEPIIEGCIDGGNWAEQNKNDILAKALYLKGCLYNEGQACASLYFVNRKYKDPSQKDSLKLATQLLIEECDAGLTSACKTIITLSEECPAIDRICKNAKLYVISKQQKEKGLSENKDVEAEKLRLLKEQNKSVDENRKVQEKIYQSQEASRHSQEWQNLSNKLNDSFKSIYKPTTNCTSSKSPFGDTVYTTCN